MDEWRQELDRCSIFDDAGNYRGAAEYPRGDETGSEEEGGGGVVSSMSGRRDVAIERSEDAIRATGVAFGVAIVERAIGAGGRSGALDGAV